MVAIVEAVIATTVLVTITAIMSAHHLELRVSQRFLEDGNKYHRTDQKLHRLKARVGRQGTPPRAHCRCGECDIN